MDGTKQMGAWRMPPIAQLWESIDPARVVAPPEFWHNFVGQSNAAWLETTRLINTVP